MSTALEEGFLTIGEVSLRILFNFLLLTLVLMLLIITLRWMIK